MMLIDCNINYCYVIKVFYSTNAQVIVLKQY